MRRRAMFSTLLQPKPVEKYIQFEDAEVERVLMSKGVSSDGVGITMEDAAKVTSIEKWFQNNTAITSFDEFEYFTAVTKLVGGWNSGAFYGCTNLKSIKFPPSLSSLGNDCFMNCSNLSIDVDIPNLAEVGYGVFHATRIKRIVNLGRITSIGNAGSSSSHTFAGMCPDLSEVILPKTLTALGNKAFTENPNMEKVISYAVTPPSLGNYVFSTRNSALIIYVPDASLEAYKTATNWNTYADRIHPLSEIEDYYISDALLMHLDGINKGNVDGEWQDLVGSIVFTNKGATAADTYWHFDGSGYLESNDTGYLYSENRTIEIVFEIENFDANAVLLAMSASQYGFGLFKTSGVIAASMDMNSAVYPLSYTKGSIATVAITRSTLYTNGEVIASTQQSAIAFSADTMYIGRRSTGNNFYGKIYAIRIHDRALSEEEILYNQRIDNKRFNLGLDI